MMHTFYVWFLFHPIPIVFKKVTQNRVNLLCILEMIHYLQLQHSDHNQYKIVIVHMRTQLSNLLRFAFCIINLKRLRSIILAVCQLRDWTIHIV